MTLDEWMEVAEVAKLLKVDPKTVKRWLLAGEMRGSRLGDRAGWRIARAEVERFMRERQNVADSNAPHEDWADD